MVIKDTNTLKEAIADLHAKQQLAKIAIINNLNGINKTLDPVHLINKFLPRKIPAGESINNFIDYSIENAATVIKEKFDVHQSNSLVKTAGNNLLKNAVSMAINKNAFKIKVVGLAILKNVF